MDERRANNTVDAQDIDRSFTPSGFDVLIKHVRVYVDANDISLDGHPTPVKHDLTSSIIAQASATQYPSESFTGRFDLSWLSIKYTAQARRSEIAPKPASQAA